MSSRPSPLFVNEMLVPQFLGATSYFPGHHPVITLVPNEQVQQLVGSCSETLQTVASSGSSLVPYPAGASHQMDMNRYLSMQSTIRHLQTMLGKEVKDRKRQDEEMMARFEEFQKANQSLRDQLQEALKDKLRMEGEMHSNLQGAITSNNELQTTRKQLAELKRELNEAHSHIADLKSNKMALENKLAQSENCLKAAKVELQELEASKSSMRNVLQELQVQSETMKKEKEELEAANAALKCSNKELGSRLEEQDARPPSGRESEQFLALKTKNQQLEAELGEAIESNRILDEKFKEVGLKLVRSVSYGGHRTYNRYTQKTEDILKRLEIAKKFTKDPTVRANLQKAVDAIQGQLQLIEDCRQDLKMTVEILEDRLDQGFAAASDLTFRPRYPAFRIPPSCYNELLCKITGIRSDLIDAASDDEDVEEKRPTPTQGSGTTTPVPSWLC